MSSGALPRVLDLQQFLNARQPEVEALAAANEQAGGQHWGAGAQPRHLRRRATSHLRRRHKYRPNAQRAKDPTIPINRAMRRRRGRLQHAFNMYAKASSKDDLLGAPASPPLRLATHVWHAKRFTMHARWGVVLPKGLVGKGKGARAFLHKASKGVIMHDASYWHPLCVQGRHRTILTMFQPLCSVQDHQRLQGWLAAYAHACTVQSPKKTAPKTAAKETPCVPAHPTPCTQHGVQPMDVDGAPNTSDNNNTNANVNTNDDGTDSSANTNDSNIPNTTNNNSPNTATNNSNSVGDTAGVGPAGGRPDRDNVVLKGNDDNDAQYIPTHTQVSEMHVMLQTKEEGALGPVMLTALHQQQGKHGHLTLLIWVHPSMLATAHPALSTRAHACHLILHDWTGTLSRIQLQGPSWSCMVHAWCAGVQGGPVRGGPAPGGGRSGVGVVVHHDGARVGTSEGPPHHGAYRDDDPPTQPLVPQGAGAPVVYRWDPHAWEDMLCTGIAMWVRDPRVPGATADGGVVVDGGVVQEGGVIEAPTTGAAASLAEGPEGPTLEPLAPYVVASMRAAARHRALLLPQIAPSMTTNSSIPPVSTPPPSPPASAIWCPTVLLPHEHQQGGVMILPRAWTMVAWQTLLTAGVHVAGLQEWRWLATQHACAVVPFDYVETPAYLATALHAHDAAVAWEARRPPGKVPPGVNGRYPPAWGMLGKPRVFMGGKGTQVLRDNHAMMGHGNQHGAAVDGGLHVPEVQAMQEDMQEAVQKSTLQLPRGCEVVRQVDVFTPMDATPPWVRKSSKALRRLCRITGSRLVWQPVPSDAPPEQHTPQTTLVPVWVRLIGRGVAKEASSLHEGQQEDSPVVGYITGCHPPGRSPRHVQVLAVCDVEPLMKQLYLGKAEKAVLWMRQQQGGIARQVLVSVPSKAVYAL